MSMAYVLFALSLLLLAYLCYLVARISKNQRLKKIHIEISKGIRFDSEFYNTVNRKKTRPHHLE